jgi:sugar phosphate isomerase/epimerase
LAERVPACGLSHVQLALDPIRIGEWDELVCVEILAAAGVTVRSGMMAMRGEDYSTLESIRRTGGVRPDTHWVANLAAARENASLAARLGLPLVTFHAGFIPERRDHPLRPVMIQRLRQVVDRFEAEGVGVAFETGQETADTLLDVLDELDRPSVGVNFDPANMILYGMGDPVAALRVLAPFVRQIHIKDAVPSPIAEQWGEERIVGRGSVNWPAFFEVIEELGIGCDLMIEREAGTSRVADITTAAGVIAHCGAN